MIRTTTWIVANKYVEKWLNEWVEAVLEKLGEDDLVVSNNVEGSFYSPSTRKKYYRTGGFTFSNDIFKKESVKPFLKSKPFGFYFVEPNLIKKE